MGDVRFPPPTGMAGSYAYLRSYMYGFATNWPAGCSQTFSAGLWTLTLPPAYGDYSKVMRLKTNVLTWSSNTYTFDWLWEDFYVVYNPTGVRQNPEGFNIHLKYKSNDLKAYHALDVGFWTEWYYIKLPPAPSSYWTR